MPFPVKYVKCQFYRLKSKTRRPGFFNICVGGFMSALVTIIHILVSIIIIMVVLLQVGKGASIGSTFGGGASSQTLFGSAGPATLLTKITAACAVIFMLTSLYLTYISGKTRTSSIMSSVPTVTAPPSGAQTAPSQALPPAGSVQTEKVPSAPAPASVPAKK